MPTLKARVLILHPPENEIFFDPSRCCCRASMHSRSCSITFFTERGKVRRTPKSRPPPFLRPTEGLHGSGQAAFPHPALALGDDAHAPQGIGMTDRRQRQPASDEAPHSIPKNAAVLAPPRQRAMPRPADSESKNRQRRLVRGHSVISKVSTHNRPQPLALFGDGFVHAPLKFGFYLIQRAIAAGVELLRY